MTRLNEIQKELKAPKGQMNSFGNYKYRSCEDIVEAVKPLLGDASLLLSDEIVLIGDRYYVKATAELVDGTTITRVSAFAREPLEKKGMDTAQITGATSSYARKYALNGLFAIDDTKDADTMDNSNMGQNKPNKGIPTANTDKFFEKIQPTDEEVISWTEKLDSATSLKELKSFAETVPQLVKDKIGKAKFDEIKAKLK